MSNLCLVFGIHRLIHILIAIVATIAITVAHIVVHLLVSFVKTGHESILLFEFTILTLLASFFYSDNAVLAEGD